jgi:hypothetical protein
MKLKGFDLDQVRAEATAIEDHRKHELSRGRKPPDDDTIRIPNALLLALLDRVDPPPSKNDIRLTTSGYVKPGTYCGFIPQPKPEPTFSNPCNISAAELTVRTSPYEFETTADMNNLCFTVPDSAVPLMLDLQTGHITHSGAVVGRLPHTDSSGTLNINSLTVKCHKDYSMGHVVVTDVKVNQ